MRILVAGGSGVIGPDTGGSRSTDDGDRQFQLFLVNGVTIDIAVTEAAQPGDGEDSDILADGAQDATGLRNTLFVLEGVAAEGRSWWAGPAYRRAG